MQQPYSDYACVRANLRRLHGACGQAPGNAPSQHTQCLEGNVVAPSSVREGSPLHAVTRHRVPRRKFLTGMGAGVVVTWTKPIMSSIDAGSAQPSPAPCPPEECTCFCSSFSQVCGSDANGPCLCTLTTEETCFCGSDIECGGHGFCQSSEDCPPGDSCVAVCCTDCGFELAACLPPCGQGQESRAPRSSVPK